MSSKWHWLCVGLVCRQSYVRALVTITVVDKRTTMAKGCQLTEKWQTSRIIIMIYLFH